MKNISEMEWNSFVSFTVDKENHDYGIVIQKLITAYPVMNFSLGFFFPVSFSVLIIQVLLECAKVKL